MLKNIVWNPQSITPIHGHNSRGCFVLVTEGKLIESVYVRENGEPKIVDVKVLSPGDITYNHDAIGFHVMENDSETHKAVTLHCYHPPYDVTNVMRGTGEIRKSELKYYSKEGNLVEDLSPGVI